MVGKTREEQKIIQERQHEDKITTIYRYKEDSDESSSGQWIHENESKRQIKYGLERMKEFE
jgi:hypothetical protein